MNTAWPSSTPSMSSGARMPTTNREVAPIGCEPYHPSVSGALASSSSGGFWNCPVVSWGTVPPSLVP